MPEVRFSLYVLWALAAALPCRAAGPTGPSVSDATAESVWHSPAAASAPAGEARAAQPGWLRPRAWNLHELRVVELPQPTTLGVHKRKHHALTWRNDTLSQTLDNAGVSNAECHNRLRLPSRLKQAPGSNTTVEVQLQFAIGCSF